MDHASSARDLGQDIEEKAAGSYMKDKTSKQEKDFRYRVISYVQNGVVAIGDWNKNAYVVFMNHKERVPRLRVLCDRETFSDIFRWLSENRDSNTAAMLPVMKKYL